MSDSTRINQNAGTNDAVLDYEKNFIEDSLRKLDELEAEIAEMEAAK